MNSINHALSAPLASTEEKSETQLHPQTEAVLRLVGIEPTSHYLADSSVYRCCGEYYSDTLALCLMTDGGLEMARFGCPYCDFEDPAVVARAWVPGHRTGRRLASFLAELQVVDLAEAWETSIESGLGVTQEIRNWLNRIAAASHAAVSRGDNPVLWTEFHPETLAKLLGWLPHMTPKEVDTCITLSRVSHLASLQTMGTNRVVDPHWVYREVLVRAREGCGRHMKEQALIAAASPFTSEDVLEALIAEKDAGILEAIRDNSGAPDHLRAVAELILPNAPEVEDSPTSATDPWSASF